MRAAAPSAGVLAQSERPSDWPKSSISPEPAKNRHNGARAGVGRGLAARLVVRGGGGGIPKHVGDYRPPECGGDAGRKIVRPSICLIRPVGALSKNQSSRGAQIAVVDRQIADVQIRPHGGFAIEGALMCGPGRKSARDADREINHRSPAVQWSPSRCRRLDVRMESA